VYGLLEYYEYTVFTRREGVFEVGAVSASTLGLASFCSLILHSIAYSNTLRLHCPAISYYYYLKGFAIVVYCKHIKKRVLKGREEAFFVNIENALAC
jgi:hypothetical protein